MNYKLNGWRPNPTNIDHKLFDKSIFGAALPISTGDVDLRPFSSPRHDQGQYGCCVAESTIKALEIKHIIKHGMASHVPLSVLDLYYNARDRMNPKETNLDNGTHLYLACEVLKELGVCRDVMWPFASSSLFTAPTLMADREDYTNKITDSYLITSTSWDRVDAVIANLQMQNPVVFGTGVGQSWFSYTAASEPLNVTKFDDIKGGHAICIVGYVGGNFIIENSWGQWGNDGFAFVTPEVIADDSSTDFHVIISGSEIWIQK